MTTGTFTRIRCPIDGRLGPSIVVCRHALDLPPSKLTAVPRLDGSGLVAVVCGDCLAGPPPFEMTNAELLDAYRLACRCPRCLGPIIDHARPLWTGG